MESTADGQRNLQDELTDFQSDAQTIESLMKEPIDN